MALSDDVDKLGKNQAALQKNFTYLKNKVDALQKRVSELEAQNGVTAPQEEAIQAPVARAAPKQSKESAKPIENLGFKIFGAVGFILILLGLFFLYRYAIDQGYIGIAGRVTIGVIFSVVVLITAEVFRRKEYVRFSQLLTGGGLALLYFTFYATYLFREYRAALGMSAAITGILLLTVMLIAVILALRYDSMLMTAYAFLLGYLAPLLIGAVEPSGNVHMMMIATLLLSIGMAVILWKKNWALGIYPVIISYLIYAIMFFSQDVLRYAAAGEIPGIVGPALIYLFGFFLLFNLMALLLQDSRSNVQNVSIAVTNGLAMLLFGLPIIWRYWSLMRGVFLIFIAALYLGMTFIARQREQRNMFEAFFLLCITFVTIAIPVQLEHAWIALAWAIEGALLIRSGVRVGVRGIRILGYIALGLAFINTLFWGIQLPVAERILSFIVSIAAAYLGAYWLAQEKEGTQGELIMAGIMVAIGSLLLTIMIFVEIRDPQGIFGALSYSARSVLVSILWAAAAVAFIVWGFVGRSQEFRMMGIGLFAITVLKILLFDLDNISPIYRTLVTIVVGMIALGAAFAYIRNKEKIKAYLGA